MYVNSKQQTTPAGSNEQASHFANDILGCIFQFIRDCAYDDRTPKLSDAQILRGWQSLPTAPPANEYVVITHLTASRHGTNAYKTIDSGEAIGRRITAAHYEHLVQVDFLSTDEPTIAAISRRRVLMSEMMLNAYYMNNYMHHLNPAFSVLYCDAPTSLAEPDEAHRLRQRHTLTIHISETVEHTMPIDIVETVHIEPRPLTRGNQED